MELEKKLFFLKGDDVTAKYKRGQIEKYRNNPLIEALRPVDDMATVIKKLTKPVRFKERDRNKNETLRAHCIYDMARLVQPLENHLRIEQSLSILIRDGYVDRNPITVNGVRIRNEGADHVAKTMKSLTNSQSVSNDNLSYKSSGGGLTLIGVSGMGKTTALNNILMTMYPAQVIRHGQYKGKNLNFTQIVWMKLECPSKGSLRSLCLHFFQVLKELVGESHYDSFVKNRSTVDQMLPQMAQMCATYFVGSLIIDEIQHLSGEEEEIMLNFFVTLKNLLGVPIILIGTNKAWDMLSKEFRQLRRACEHFGVIFWERMEYCSLDGQSEAGIDWKIFLSSLWKYQWLKNPEPLTEEVCLTLYEHSQGVTDIAVKVFMIAQWKAINSGVERITPHIIQDVADNELRAMKPVLQALRFNDYKKLEAMKDIYVNDHKIDKYFNQALADLAKRNLTVVKAERDEKGESARIDIEYEAIKWLVEASVPRNHADAIVKALMHNHKEITLPELKNLAFSTYLNAKQTVDKKTKPARLQRSTKNKTAEPIDLSQDIMTAH